MAIPVEGAGISLSCAMKPGTRNQKEGALARRRQVKAEQRGHRVTGLGTWLAQRPALQESCEGPWESRARRACAEWGHGQDTSQGQQKRPFFP